MRIAQIAPLAESVPPKLYGGTERVVSWLTDDLVELGHEVTLFASGDSETRATLIPVWSAALRLSKRRVDPIIAQTVSAFCWVFSTERGTGYPGIQAIGFSGGASASENGCRVPQRECSRTQGTQPSPRLARRPGLPGCRSFWVQRLTSGRPSLS
jgi:hypothetical protein